MSRSIWKVRLMTFLNASQRAHELLTVLGENAPAWFAFDEQLAAFRALDEFTIHGTHIDGLSPTPNHATDPVTVLTELLGCLATLVRDASGLNDALRYSRVLDLVRPLSPRRADG